jgi:hypothetical protein
MGDVVPIRGWQPTVMAQLDASEDCIRRMDGARMQSAADMRIEALKARLDLASLRELKDQIVPAGRSSGGAPSPLEAVWDRLEEALDEVMTYAVCCSEQTGQPQRNYALRGQLRLACQRALTELGRLRTLVIPGRFTVPLGHRQTGVSQSWLTSSS